MKQILKIMLHISIAKFQNAKLCSEIKLPVSQQTHYNCMCVMCFNLILDFKNEQVGSWHTFSLYSSCYWICQKIWFTWSSMVHLHFKL